jgi:hypothetical protein
MTDHLPLSQRKVLLRNNSNSLLLHNHPFPRDQLLLVHRLPLLDDHNHLHNNHNSLMRFLTMKIPRQQGDQQLDQLQPLKDHKLPSRFLSNKMRNQSIHLRIRQQPGDRLLLRQHNLQSRHLLPSQDLLLDHLLDQHPDLLLSRQKSQNMKNQKLFHRQGDLRQLLLLL